MKYSELYSAEMLEMFKKHDIDLSQIEIDLDSPVINIETILDLCKVKIREEYQGDFSGMVRKDVADNYEIIINPFDSEKRKRFTMAHELGHVLLESPMEERRRDTVMLSNYSPTERVFERQANRFAAQLIMPLGLLKILISRWIKLKNDGEFNLKEDRFEQMVSDISIDMNVSTDALRIRLQSLGIKNE